MSNPSLGIKQSRDGLVKPGWRHAISFLLVLVCLAVCLVPALSARADDENPNPDESLPQIEAKTFDATVVRRSRSGHVYLFQSSETLRYGKILLLREDHEPIMAFRVLRDYPAKEEFAAKWVRQYRGIDQLEPGHEYSGIEKLADREAPPLTEEDQNELKEVEGEIPPPPATEAAAAANARLYDAELDATTSPPPKSVATVAQAPQLSAADEAEIDDLQNITAEELVPIEREKNWFSAGYGYFRNNGASPGANMGYLGGVDMKYARTLKTMIYFKRKNLQDSVVLEGGLGYYRLINFSSSNDTFNVVPLTVTLRYNFNFGEDFATFIYLGINQNIVMSSATANTANQSAVSTASSQLTSTLPAIGAGLLFHVGPGWYIRSDIGLDLLGLGFVLRY